MHASGSYFTALLHKQKQVPHVQPRILTGRDWWEHTTHHKFWRVGRSLVSGEQKGRIVESRLRGPLGMGSQVPLANKEKHLQDESALKKPERTSGGARMGYGEASWEHTFWPCSEQAGSKQVKGNRREAHAEGKCKSLGVRPTVRKAGGSLWLVGLAAAKVLTFEFTSLGPTQPPFFPVLSPTTLQPNLSSSRNSTSPSRPQLGVSWPPEPRGKPFQTI